MSDFRFVDVAMLHALWLLPALAAAMAYAARRRRRDLRRFVEGGLLDKLGTASVPDPARRVLKAVLALAAVGSLVVALARPAWDAVRDEVTQRGRDVVFLLDVSRSMLAEDLPPNRLERAKLAILDAVDGLDGDRVALVVFAGSTVVKCPLTLDYGFFRMALEDVSPLSVARGGSLMGDGLRAVLRDVFDGKRSNHRDVVLITDGEDHESFPVEAAAEAGRLGVRLIAIGLGDERVGRRIPVPADGPGQGRGFLLHEGREVWSKLDAATLRLMADATPGGIYLNVATGAIDFGAVYRRLIATADRREVGAVEIDRLEEKFQVFLALCVLLLALEIGLRERRRAASAATALLLALALAPARAGAASVRGLVNEGNDAYRSEAFEEALQSYDRALERDPDSPYATLNRANALYRSGNFAEAAEGYSQAVRQSLARDLPRLEANGLHNLGNALYRQAEESAATDPRGAIELLAPAARAYLDALRADGRRSDSAHNLEMTRRLIQRLREQASQQPQSGGQGGHSPPQDQQDGDPGESLQQAADEQRRLAEESRQLDEDRREQRGSDARQEQRQRAQDLADRQEDLRQRTQQLGQEAGQQAREQIERAGVHQRDARQELERGQPGEASESQRRAAEALQAAADGRSGQPRNAEQARPSESPEAPGGPSGEEREQRELTMDRILAKERQDRRRRQLRNRVGAVAVDRDW